MGRPISLLQEELAFPFEKQGLSQELESIAFSFEREKNLASNQALPLIITYVKREEGESLVFLDHVFDIDDVFGRGLELAVTFTHAHVQNEVRTLNEGWNNSKSSATF